MKYTHSVQAKSSYRKSPLLSFTHLNEGRPPPNPNRLFRTARNAQTFCVPQLRTQASSNQLRRSCRLPAQIIKSRSSVSPGIATLKATTSSNIKYRIFKGALIVYPSLPLPIYI